MSFHSRNNQDPVVKVKFWLYLALGLVLQVRAPVTLAQDAEVKELYFGSVAMDVPAVMHRRLSPLTKYLSGALQRPVSLKLSPDMSAAIKEISNGTVHLAYLTPVAYVKAQNSGDVRLLVKTVTKGAGSYQLMIVTKEGSAVRSIEDLAGKRFAFGDKAALLQRAVVVGAGMPLERLGSYSFIGHYDNVLHGVMNGDFDGGILKDTMANKWKGKGLKILHASAALPPFNIAASRNMNPKLAEQVRGALLKLDIRKPAHAQVLQALDEQYTGFAPVKDEDYNAVRKLIKPFQKE